MFTLLPQLDGRRVRLEPLQPWHAAGLAEAAAADPALYQLSAVPQGEAAAEEYIEAALAERDAGAAAPFAVLRVADGAVIGSTRFWDLAWWPWPQGHPRHGLMSEPKGEMRRRAGPGGEQRETQPPDVCEIGYTWLARSAIRTAANTEMKRLMLGHAFEVWQVESVCLHTDARNERSRRAMERIGAQFEGILRAHRLGIDCLPRNSARYSITAPEWPRVRRRLDDMLGAREEAGTRP
jgi:RimJ/RimL family protein N-acetyltransferase